MSTSSKKLSPQSQQVSKSKSFFRWLAVLALVYLLIVAVGVISSGFRTAAGEGAEELFAFAENPFLGLMIGILATVLLQSSTTTTAIIVALVAGGLPIALAVPMVMGSNIGTTITCGIVSLGYIGNKEEFRKAFAVSTVLDLFNLLAVLIFFPLEIIFPRTSQHGFC